MAVLFDVKAQVRRANAIGLFYPVTFRVTVEGEPTRDRILNAWQEANCETWELNHLIDWKPTPGYGQTAQSPTGVS